MSATLLRTRRFLPLFLTQFLGALNDNFFKTAVVILVTYRTSQELHISPQTLVTLSGALFVLPYIMFCATAGKLADKYDKALMARLIKYAEVIFMLLASLGFYLHCVPLLFLVLFCMGTHSAFFSPVKYALLPEHLREDELMEGNGFIESCTFIAILLGTIAGGGLVLREDGELIVSAGVLTIAFLGVVSSHYIPAASTRNPAVVVHVNIMRETWDILTYVKARRELFKSVLTNSWFWFMALTFLTQLPAYTKEVIHGNESVVTLFLVSFSVGTGFGAIACGAVQRGRISTHYIPWAVLLMSLFAADMYYASPQQMHAMQNLLTLREFLEQPHSYRMVVDLLLFSVSGGFFLVPTYAVIQKQCEPRHRAQTMACNNVVNAAFMVASAGLAWLLVQWLGFSVAQVFLTAAVLNILVSIWLFTPRGRIKAGE